MAHHQPQHAGEEEGAPEIAHQPARGERQPEVRGEHQRHVMPVLEGEHAVAPQVGDVAEVLAAARVLPHHPADVREPEAAQRRVGVAVHVIDVEVMPAVAAAPGPGAVLQRHRAEDHEEQAQAPMRVVSPVRPEPVVAGGDRHLVGHQEDAEEHPGRSREAMRSGRTRGRVPPQPEKSMKTAGYSSRSGAPQRWRGTRSSVRWDGTAWRSEAPRVAGKTP